jgi:hypothetical protein
MLNSPPMPPPAPVAILDTLCALLDSEVQSVFRFMGEGSPYLSRATADVRRPLQEMVETNQRHVRDLADLIESLGGVPRLMPGVSPEEQFLAFLSLKFLLPKLVNEKELVIRRYENALRALAASAPPEVRGLLESHLAEHREQLKVLQRASEEVIRAK